MYVKEIWNNGITSTESTRNKAYLFGDAMNISYLEIGFIAEDDFCIQRTHVVVFISWLSWIFVSVQAKVTAHKTSSTHHLWLEKDRVLDGDPKSIGSDILILFKYCTLSTYKSWLIIHWIFGLVFIHHIANANCPLGRKL